MKRGGASQPARTPPKNLHRFVFPAPNPQPNPNPKRPARICRNPSQVTFCASLSPPPTFSMSEAIDLTVTGDDSSSSGSGSAIASDDGTTSPRAWPSTVYLVIHDGEPQDSGSDYRSMSPARQDTEIVGIFYGIGRAVRGGRGLCPG